MTRLTRIGPLVAASVLLGACAQLIGLNQFDSTDGAAGETGASGGKGGKGGSGGDAGSAVATGGSSNASGNGGTAGGLSGAGGNSATGGKGGSDNGGMAGEAGSGGTGGKGGKGGTSGTSGGKGGTGGGTGGSSSGGDAGGAGVPGCSETIEITTHGAPTPDLQSSYTSYEYNVDPQIDTAASDYLWVDFYVGGEYDGDLTGQTFVLGTGGDENYASCSRCVWFGVDVGDSGFATTYFYAKSGELQISSTSLQMSGYPDVHLTDVLLTEVTLNSDTHVSHEIVGGRCLHLASADLVIAGNVPDGWTCSDATYLDSYCDCGCGVPDPGCTSTLAGACDYCVESGSCGEASCVNIKLDDNSQCVAANSQGWSCHGNYYGDGFCDCGCGIVDYDCPSSAGSDCEFCDDPNSCTAAFTGTCADVDPNDNSQCL